MSYEQQKEPSDLEGKMIKKMCVNIDIDTECDSPNEVKDLKAKSKFNTGTNLPALMQPPTRVGHHPG